MNEQLIPLSGLPKTKEELRNDIVRLIWKNTIGQYSTFPQFIHGVCVNYDLFMFYSFGGWVWESVFCSLSKYKKLINRGFLNGPYCTIYGHGAQTAVRFLSDIKNPVALFLTSGVMSCALEYSTSWLMEKLFHARWWDYSDKPYNLNGRIYLNGFLAFASASCLVVKKLDPQLRAKIGTWPPLLAEITAAALWTIHAVDYIVTVAGLAGFEDELQELADKLEADIKADLSEKLDTDTMNEIRQRLRPEFADRINVDMMSDFIEELRSGMKADTMTTIKPEQADELQNAIKAEVEQFMSSRRTQTAVEAMHKLNAQQRRVIKAFPRLRSSNYEHALSEIRQRMHDFKKD